MASIASSGLDRVLVTGGKQWGCTKLSVLEDPTSHREYTSRTGIILRKSGLPTQAESTLTLHTQRADYHDVFKHAQIRFRTSAFPEEGFTSHGPPKDQKNAEQQKMVTDPVVADLLRGPKRSLLAKRNVDVLALCHNASRS